MVGLNPSRFYGRLLPRPRIYCDVKFSDARVDPPESVNAALLEWAGGADWKMGGTSNKRKRMSGKIEGRMSKLRAMDESDEEEPLPPKKPEKEKQRLSFGKAKAPSAATGPAKPMTHIERMLTSPASKRGKLAPRRIISSDVDDGGKQEVRVKSKARKSRREPVIEDSDDDSDDDLEGLMQNVEATKDAPNRAARRSARLQVSPRTPQSKRSSLCRNSPEGDDGNPVSPSPLRSPISYRRDDDDSGSESDTQSEDSDSLIL